jgi:hypothetical protein
MLKRNSSIKSIERVVAWSIVVFGVVVTACGALISLSSGGKDAGGILGGVFIFGGLAVVILAFPDPTSKEP